MKVSYKGVQDDIPAKLQQKLDTKFAKLSKLVDGRGEKQAHVVVTRERHLYKAEITLNVHNHELVGVGSENEVFDAISAALDHVEKQAAKQGARWRDMTRRSEPMKTAAAKDAALAPSGPPTPPKRGAARKARAGEPAAAGSGPRVFRTNHQERRKTLTLDEALVEMEDGRDYMAYRDAERQVVSILIRRRDGHYDLIET